MTPYLATALAVLVLYLVANTVLRLVEWCRSGSRLGFIAWCEAEGERLAGDELYCCVCADTGCGRGCAHRSCIDHEQAGTGA